ncbi:MAG: response regulator [Candidatus Omnitrophota bacterium]
MDSNNKILIVDDEIDMCLLLKIELETEGYDVSIAHNGKEGVELAKEVQPDLILLDVMMPVLDGYGALKMLKESARTKDVPVFMLSAKSQESDMQKGLDMGVSDYITKPFHAGLLIKRIGLTLKKMEGKNAGSS